MLPIIIDTLSYIGIINSLLTLAGSYNFNTHIKSILQITLIKQYIILDDVVDVTAVNEGPTFTTPKPYSYN